MDLFFVYLFTLMSQSTTFVLLFLEWKWAGIAAHITDTISFRQWWREPSTSSGNFTSCIYLEGAVKPIVCDPWFRVCTVWGKESPLFTSPNPWFETTSHLRPNCMNRGWSRKTGSNANVVVRNVNGESNIQSSEFCTPQINRNRAM